MQNSGFFTFRTLIISLSLMISSVIAETQLNMWIMPNGERPSKNIKAYTDQFEKENPGITVNIEVLSWGNAISRLKMIAKTKRGPDLVQVGTTWVPYLSELGALLDLTPYMDNLSRPEEFLSATWSSTHRFGYSEIVALPWFLDVRTISLNKRHFDSMGFSRKNFETIESFKRSLKVFAQKKVTHEGKRVWPISFSGIGDWNLIHNFAPWIWSNGGSFVKEVDGKFVSNMSDPKTIQGIRENISFYFEKLIDPTDIERGTTLTEKKFNNGESFSLLGTTFGALTRHYNRVKEGKADLNTLEDMVLVPYPKGPGGQFSFIGGSNLAIPKYTKNKEAAIKLLGFLMQDSTLFHYSRDIGAFSTKKKIVNNVPEVNSDYYQAILTSLKFGRAFPNIPEWTEVGYVLKEGLENIWWQVSGIYGDFNEEYFIKELQNMDAKVNKILNNSSMSEAYDSDDMVIEIPLPGQVGSASSFIDRLGLTQNSINAIIGILLAIVIVTLILFLAKGKKD
ncbi:MAG: extracellular solute-binding protein [Fibrobacterales bacterium]